MMNSRSRIHGVCVAFLGAFILGSCGTPPAASPAPDPGARADAPKQGNRIDSLKPDAPGRPPTAVDDAALGVRLAAYGRRTHSAAALRVAAQIVDEAAPKELDSTKQSEGGEGAPVTKRAIKASRDALLAEADAMAKEGERAAGSASPQSGTRGALGGPKSHVDIVSARGTDAYTVMFKKMEPVIVRVSGDGDTDLDCSAADERGNVVDSDTGPSDDCYLRWTPAWTGPFRIKIRNLGKEANLYTLVTN